MKNIKNMKPKVKELGGVLKLAAYELPKAILRKTFTNANQTDVFGKEAFAKKKKK